MVSSESNDSSTPGCAKTHENAHPEMLQHAGMRKNARKCASRNAPARRDAQNKAKMRIQKCWQ
jgi:hypothetical protein